MNNPIVCKTHGTHDISQWVTCPTLRASMPEEWAIRLMPDRKHGVGRFSVTDCTGCPRKTALIDGGVPLDLSRMHAMAFGSAGHARMESVRPKQAELRYEGKMFGMTVSCRVDRMTPDGWVIDYKFVGAGSMKWAIRNSKKGKREFPKPEHVWQVEAERFIMAQSGVCTAGSIIWYGAHTAGAWPNWFPPCVREGPVLAEDELAAFRPFDGSFTTRELAVQAFEAAGGRSVRSLPMVGRSVAFGEKKVMCDYCQVEKACAEAGVEDTF